MIVKHLHSDNVVRNVQCMFSTVGVANSVLKHPCCFCCVGGLQTCSYLYSDGLVMWE